MTQSELNQQIAQQTGEPVTEIARRGFTLLRTLTDDNEEPASDEELMLLVLTPEQEEGE